VVGGRAAAKAAARAEARRGGATASFVRPAALSTATRLPPFSACPTEAICRLLDMAPNPRTFFDLEVDGKSLGR